jgi:hypothetical protein
MVAAPAWCY